MSGRRAPVLLASWGACLAIGLASASVFVAGVLRDTHFGQAELAVDLGAPGSRAVEKFRVWGGGNYVLWLSTLGPQPPFDLGEARRTADAPPPPEPPVFDGRLEVRLITPGGAVHRSWTFGGAGSGHAAGEGMSWSRLGEVTLRELPLNAWRLETRTVEGSAAFADARFSSRVILRPDRPDRGMGGLINYAMIVPAGLFLVLALGLAVMYGQRTGRQWPAWVSGLALLSLAALFTLG